MPWRRHTRRSGSLPSGAGLGGATAEMADHTRSGRGGRHGADRATLCSFIPLGRRSGWPRARRRRRASRASSPPNQLRWPLAERQGPPLLSSSRADLGGAAAREASGGRVRSDCIASGEAAPKRDHHRGIVSRSPDVSNTRRPGTSQALPRATVRATNQRWVTRAELVVAVRQRLTLAPQPALRGTCSHRGGRSTPRSDRDLTGGHMGCSAHRGC